jgi:hypothetical protein
MCSHPACELISHLNSDKPPFYARLTGVLVRQRSGYEQEISQFKFAVSALVIVAAFWMLARRRTNTAYSIIESCSSRIFLQSKVEGHTIAVGFASNEHKRQYYHKMMMNSWHVSCKYSRLQLRVVIHDANPYFRLRSFGEFQHSI